MAREFAKKFYKSKEWQQCRKLKILSVNGLCERCKTKGIIKPGKIVHHKKYLTPQNIDNPMISLSLTNLEYLCQDCHNEEHHAQDITRDGLVFDEEGNLVQL